MLLLLLFLRLEAGPLDDLAFLAGCWAGENSEEVWLKPAGGNMLGVGRTLRDGRAAVSEFMHIAAGEGGTLVMSVQQKLGGPVTAFKLIKSGDGSAAFENPAHDFPQRILYRRNPDGSLFARIEGNAGGKARSRDFRFRPAECR